MQLENFKFDYPEDLVAFEAVEPRDRARLLLSWDRGHRHKYNFSHLPELVRGDEIFVFNDTRVIPCRLFARRKTGARVEIFLLNPLEDQGSLGWKCLVKPGRKVHEGEELTLEDDPSIGIRIFPTQNQGWEMHWGCPPHQVLKLLERIGHIPLPPYIRRPDREDDSVRYQTVFAHSPGASAAPTAGLHFTHELIRQLAQKGCEIHFVTLHVGLGTFSPVKESHIQNHKMHPEYYSMGDETLQTLDGHFRAGREVVCVGTTSLRAVETAMKFGPEGYSKAFFHPENPPQFVRSLITNFHQPQSTLFMLVCSLLGTEVMQSLYREAFQEKYRLFSYGDGMWLRVLN